MRLKFGWDSKPEKLPWLIKELVISPQACQVQYLKLKAGIIFIQSIMHYKRRSIWVNLEVFWWRKGHEAKDELWVVSGQKLGQRRACAKRAKLVQNTNYEGGGDDDKVVEEEEENDDDMDGDDDRPRIDYREFLSVNLDQWKWKSFSPNIEIMPKAENASYNIEVEPFSVRKISRNRPASVDCTLLHMSCENSGKKHCKAILNNKSTEKVEKKY